MEDSGYISRTSTEDLNEVIIYAPELLPKAPCLLRDHLQLKNALEKINTKDIFNNSNANLSIATTNNDKSERNDIKKEGNKEDKNNEDTYNFKREDNNDDVEKDIIETKDKDTPKPARIVMLTFAEDGQEIANNLANILRAPNENSERIGVVILQEQGNVLNNDPHAFIMGCYSQVDFIVPIVTDGYLKSINIKKRTDAENTSRYIDTVYTRFIYNLMMNEYQRNNCTNKRIRTIIPDQQFNHIYKSMKNFNILNIFHRFSDAQKFTDRIHKYKI